MRLSLDFKFKGKQYYVEGHKYGNPSEIEIVISQYTDYGCHTDICEHTPELTNAAYDALADGGLI